MWRGVCTIGSEAHGISANYYRNIEKGWAPQRVNSIKSSPDTLKKIVAANKVDYLKMVEAAGYENDPAYNSAATAVPFFEYPTLHEWYSSLPSEDINDITKLYAIWKVMKGCDVNVL